MTDLTREQIETLLEDDYVSAERAVVDSILRQLLATIDALAEARAAQAGVVERCMEAIRAQQIASKPTDGEFERGAAQGIIDCLCAIRSLADPTGVKLLAELRARAEKADEHRLGRQVMHRRAQRAEGKSLRSIAMLDLIIAKIKDAIPVMPTLPSPYPLSLHTLYHQLHSVRRHAKNSSGSAVGVQHSYYSSWLRDAQAERDTLRAANAALEAKVAGLVGIADDIDAQVKTTREAAADSGMDRHQVELMAICTSHFLDNARHLRALATLEAGNG